MQILDCTIRDGSYVIDGQWTREDVRNIVGELAAAGFTYIEVGNGVGLGAHRKNVPSICSDVEYITTAVESKGSSKIGVFFIPGIGNKDDIVLLKNNGGDFIRIGTNVSQSDDAREYIKFAKSLGLEVGYNFMKSYAVSPFELCNRALRIQEYGADRVSLVDSAGGMLPNQVGHYISVLKDCLDIEIGFHGHNNLLLANANSLAAVENGATIIDATLMGMGRGAGNSQTESMLVILEKSGYKLGIDPLKVSRISEKYIATKTSKIKGSNGLELVLGYALFHDSYLELIESYSHKYSVDYQQLICEVSKINKENPSAALIEEIARQLKNQKRVDIFFPKFYHREIK